MIVGLTAQQLPGFDGPPDQFLSTARFRTADLVSSRLIGEGVGMPIARWRSSLGRDALTKGYSHHTVILQNSGDDVRRIDSDRFASRRSKPGSLLILPAGMNAAWRSEDVSDRTHFYVHPELVRQVSHEIHGAACQLRDDCMFIFDNGLADLLRRYSFLVDSTLASRFERDMVTLEIATMLVRRYSDFAEQPASNRDQLKSQQLRAVIEDNLAGKLRAEEISRMLGLSLSVLKKLAQLEFGMPLHRYIVERRLQKAEELIRGGVPIAQAAFDAGFASQSHLTSTMSARRGVTPAALGKGSHARIQF